MQVTVKPKPLKPMKVNTQTDESCDENCIANRWPNAEIQTNKKAKKRKIAFKNANATERRHVFLRETEQFLALVNLPSDDSLPFVTFVLPQKTKKKKTKRLILG